MNPIKQEKLLICNLKEKMLHPVLCRMKLFYNMLIKNPVYIVKDIVRMITCKGETLIDATCGNGYDTVFLAELTGQTGTVFAFDIQKEAIENTRKKVECSGVSNRVRLIMAGHENIDKYVDGQIACAMFNLGYLPGSDRKTSTRWQSTITGIQKSMNLLRTGGIITIIIYHGKETGYEERDKVLEFLQDIDYKQFNVLKLDYMNRVNDPPIPIIIEKL